MWEKLNNILSKRKTVLFFLVFVIGLAGVTPVLADYIGPNRTITETTSVCKVNLYECKYVASKDEYRYKIIDSWSCSNESKPWKAYASDPSPWGCSAMTDGDTYWSQDEIIQEVTNTYPPATIKGVLQSCTLRNGWCITAPQLALTGSEPVAGYQITAIEGTLNGKTFACSGTNCTVPLIEGNNNFTYWALSSWGDSSTMGTLTAKVDSKQPTIAGTLTGTSGSNGWYVSPVSFNGSASDTTSGLASFTCVLDGLSLASCSSISITGEGAHSLVLTARDNAGNIRASTTNAAVDTQNPNLDASFAGTLGSNNWFTSAVLNGTASDPLPGSDISAFEYNLDGSGWVSFPASGALDLPEGQHTIDIHALDYAGHAVSSSKSFSLDSVPPEVVVDAAGTVGSNDWYVTNPTVSASATDSTSGLDVFEYSLDNSAWTSYTSAITLDEGAHTISFWAQDQAGLVKQVDHNYQVDTRLPQIAGSISGITGQDGWYTSDVTLSASASDPAPGSGLDAFTYILDGSAPTSYSVPLTFTDGQHELQFTAQDQAGLSYSIQQTIKVDTQPPSLSILTSLPAWIKGNITLSGTAADTGSGLSKVEISTDDGNTWQALSDVASWNFNWNTQNSADGSYKVHIRATDKAGLTTEQVFTVGLDNHAPSISLPDSWLQWNAVTLDIWDDYSGLADARIEIIDPHGHWPTRSIELDPQQFPLSFKWDRRWGDGTTAPSGDYQVQVTAIDNLGQVAKQSASIEIVLNILPAGPTATPQTYVRPQPTVTPSYTATSVIVPTATPTAVISAFGAIAPTVQAVATPTVVVTPRATPTQTTILNWLESFFAPNPDSTNQTTELVSLDESRSANARDMGSQSNVLWGAAAAAAIGAATAYSAEERRRQQASLEAEKEAQRQRHEAKMEQDAIKAAEKEQRHATVTQHMQKLEAQHLQEALWEQARLKQKTPDITYEDLMEAKMAQTEQQQDAAWMVSQQIIQKRNEEKKKAEELKAGLAAYYNATKQGNTVAERPEQKTWWEKSLDWIDNHQTEIALGIGVAVGVAAIVITGGIAGPLLAAAYTASAAAMAATTVAVGTVALNKYYGRDWNENLAGNMAVAGLGAAVVAGAWFTFQIGTTSLGAYLANYCDDNPTKCANFTPVFKAIDTGEELWLRGKMAYQKWKGDDAGALDTLMQWEMEQMDGDMPGNTVSKEVKEDIIDLGADGARIAEKYGTDTIPLLLKYREDAVNIIGAYGEDGIALLRNYGDDVVPLLLKYQDDAVDIINTYEEDGLAVLAKYGDDAIKLIKDHGTPALKLMNTLKPDAANKLLTTLDDDILEYASQQGDDAIEALALWDEKNLQEYGVELALRAKKDGVALSAAKELAALGPINPEHPTEKQMELIKKIAENSTQYEKNGQIALGKWTDFSSGFVENARNTGSKYYGPHPEIWNTLEGLGTENQSEAAWLINQQVIRNGIKDKLPFEFSLNGIPNQNIVKEHDAIEALFSGETEREILDALDAKVMPIRMKELQELKEAGYKLVFDATHNSYILALP